MKKLALLSSFALAAAVSPLLGQAILFQHDFSTSSDPDQMTHGNHTGTVNPGRVPDTSTWVYRANPPTTAPMGPEKYIEITDANSPFGAGNQYLRVHYENMTGTLWTSATNQFSSQVVTVEFDFYRPTTTSWGATNSGDDSRFRLGINDPVGSNDNRVQNELRFNGDGSISGSAAGAYSFDTVHTVHFVYNNSESQASYVDRDLTVDSGHFDVWLDGTRIVAGGGDGTSDWLAIGQNLTSVGILTGQVPGAVEMMFDNLVVYEGAHVIPEPSTYAFGAGILALGAAWMWRRRRAA